MSRVAYALAELALLSRTLCPGSCTFIPLGSDRNFSLSHQGCNITAHGATGLQEQRPTLSPTVSLPKACLSSAALSLLPHTACFFFQLLHMLPPFCGFSEAHFQVSPRQPLCLLMLSQDLRASTSHHDKQRDPSHCCPALKIFFVLPGSPEEGYFGSQSMHHEASPIADTLKRGSREP